jgi:excisionase family DNA binding protein
MKNNDNINIIIDHQLTPVVKSEKCAAYLAEVLKTAPEKETVKQNDTKGADLNQLKEKKLLSVTEASKLFGIGMNRIRELSNDKDCPFVIWIGSHRKIKREEFEKFLKGRQSA